MEDMQDIVSKLLAPQKGILAADESTNTAGKRLLGIGLENTEENRRAYRELFLNTEGIGEYLSGVILYDETIRQKDRAGAYFRETLEEAGVLVGIKVDMGTKDLSGFPGESVTEGLDGLEERLSKYKDMGAAFTKWRAVIRIKAGIPSAECVHANALDMARYAKTIQEHGLVPIVEPEVLLHGTHTIQESKDVIARVTTETMYQIERMRGDLSAVILKSSMALPGDETGKKASPDEVAQATIEALRASVPESVPGIVFLSGGQAPEEACENLKALRALKPYPWTLTFSFARALQEEALTLWQGKPEHEERAREAFLTALKRAVGALV